jgi:PAS domain-containing protein
MVHYLTISSSFTPKIQPWKAINASVTWVRPCWTRRSGHRQLAVLDRRPMPEEPRVRTIFQIFAARASAELQRLRADAERRRTEEKYRRIIQTTDAGFVLMNPDFIVTDVNRAFCRMVECAREKILGRSLLKFIEEDDRQFMRMNQNLFAGNFTELEGKFITDSGRKSRC